MRGAYGDTSVVHGRDEAERLEKALTDAGVEYVVETYPA